LAAHLAVRWNEYREDFSAAAKELVEFGRSDVKWRMFFSLASWLPPFNLARGLEHLCDAKLLHGAEIGRLNPGGGTPNFYILATDLAVNVKEVVH